MNMNDNNFSTSTDGSLIEPIKREEFEALKLLINPQYIKAVHMTRDFYLQLMAYEKVEIITPKPGVLSIIGYPVIVHDEECRRPWWIEYDEYVAKLAGLPVILKDWIDRDKLFIHPAGT